MDIYQKTIAFYQAVPTEKRRIGQSAFLRDIFAVKAGEGRPVGIAQYAIHGREYITTELAFTHYQTGVSKGSVWIIPLVNPDGALLSQIGLQSVGKEGDKARLLRWNGKEDFSLWKANGRGVDLNVNFPARWGQGARNIRRAGAENYIGEYPFSERETLALKNFTEEIAPDYTVSYHTKGEEIYWCFDGSEDRYPRHLACAEALSKTTGYPLAFAKNSVGGYKDWCIQRFGIPSFTIEAGQDCLSHPLGEDAVEDIVKKNQWALYELSKEF